MLTLVFMGSLRMEDAELTVHKRRSQAEKVGAHKYEIQFLHRIDRRLDRIEKKIRIIFMGLAGYFQFDKPLVQKVGIETDLELAVIELIYQASSEGILAKDISARLPEFRLEQHRILRMVNRVNRKINDSFGKNIIEKRGKKWAFTDFGREIWSQTEEDLDAVKARDVESRLPTE
jgi:hypothetical protein